MKKKVFSIFVFSILLLSLFSTGLVFAEEGDDDSVDCSEVACAIPMVSCDDGQAFGETGTTEDGCCPTYGCLDEDPQATDSEECVDEDGDGYGAEFNIACTYTEVDCDDSDDSKTTSCEDDDDSDDETDEDDDEEGVVLPEGGIAEEKAKEIALGEVDGDITEVELKEDDGIVIYEVKIKNDDGEKEIKINALTGEIIEIETEDDDDDSDVDDDSEEDEVDEETRKESKLMHNNYGAIVRLLQLQKHSEIKMLHMNEVFELIKEKEDVSEDTKADLEKIIVDIESLIEKIKVLIPGATKDNVDEFIIIKKEINTLIKEFRTSVKSLLTEDDKIALKARFKEIDREAKKDIQERIKEAKKKYNEERIRKMKNIEEKVRNEIAEKIKKGEFDIEKAKTELKKRYNELDEEKQKLVREEIKKIELQKKVLETRKKIAIKEKEIQIIKTRLKDRMGVNEQ